MEKLFWETKDYIFHFSIIFNDNRIAKEIIFNYCKKINSQRLKSCLNVLRFFS